MDRALRGAVGKPPTGPDTSDHGGDVDNAAASVRREERPHGACVVYGASHMDVVKSLKYFIGGVGERQPTSPSASTGCTGST